jgi:hypothetical protein
MKNNKEDSAALAEHALKISKKLFDALKSLDHPESMKSSIDDYVEYVILLIWNCYIFSSLSFFLES